MLGAWWRLAALAALILFAATLFAVPPAQAQTAVALVGNTGQPDHATPESFTNDVAQGFTTGGNSTGYRLTAVKIRLNRVTGAGQPTYSVTIQEADASGIKPNGTVIGTLTNPSSLPTSTTNVTFSAADGGIGLAANTVYFVVWDVSATGSGSGNIETTASDAEDAGAAAGWSIADIGLFRTWNAGAWSQSGSPRQIEIDGYENPLVSNLNQDDGNRPGDPNTPGDLAGDHAQAFTTGGHGGGYKLTKVQLRLQRTSQESPTYTVKIHNALGTDPWRALPGRTVLGTLTNPATLPATESTVDFTAPGDGIDLDANTTSFVVWDVTATNNASGGIEKAGRDADGEDPGAAGGWSISNLGRYRDFNESTWSYSNSSRKIAVHGFAKVPTLVSNTGQTAQSPLSPNQDYIVRFTTGSYPDGYTLEHIDIKFSVTSEENQPSYVVRLGTNAGGIIANLDKPPKLVDGLNRFTLHSTAFLSPNTTYAIGYDQTSASSDVKVSTTRSDGEDAKKAAGWSIGNMSRVKAHDAPRQTRPLGATPKSFRKSPSMASCARIPPRRSCGAR